MLSLRTADIPYILLRAWQIFIVAMALLLVFNAGLRISHFGVWDEFSILSLAGGSIAILSIFFSATKMTRESKDTTDSWQILQNHELILMHLAQLEKIVALWSSGTHKRYESLEDLIDDNSTREARSVLRKLRREIGASIYLGDLETAEKTSEKVIGILRDTPWLRFWLESSTSEFPQEQS